MALASPSFLSLSLPPGRQQPTPAATLAQHALWGRTALGPAPHAPFPLPWSHSSPLPCHRLPVRAGAGPGGAAGAGLRAGALPKPTVDLCVFPMRSMPLPTSTGSLNVFEPHMVALLQVIQHVAASSGGAPARFAALPYEWVRTQLLGGEAAASASTSAPITGCCCQVDAALEEPAGDAWFVHYRALRRLRPLQVLRTEPFLVVRAEWVDDEGGSASSAARQGHVQHQESMQHWEPPAEGVPPVLHQGQASPALGGGGVDRVVSEAGTEQEGVEALEGRGKEAAGTGIGGAASAGELEVQLWKSLQEVASLTACLRGRGQGGGEGGDARSSGQGQGQSSALCRGVGMVEHPSHPGALLPPTVSKFAPLVSAPPEEVASGRNMRSRQTRSDVQVWRGMKAAPVVPPQSHLPSGWGSPVPAPAIISLHHRQPVQGTQGGGSRGANPDDPYWVACEAVSKGARQESFSFAAASMVDLGPEQQQLLLSMTDTAERLRWVLKAIEPHLSALKAEFAVRRAMGDL